MLFSKRIGKLVNLRHMYLGDDFMKLPKEVGKLHSLETVDCKIEISVESNTSSKKLLTLEELSKLNRLNGRLSILIAEVKDVEEAERAQALKNKQGLVDLVLDLEGTKALESQLPHQKLKRLEIRNYCGTTLFPSWMTKLVHLKTFYLYNCPNCEVLGAFGKLPSLESLTIVGMKKVKRVGIEFLGIEETTIRGNQMENSYKIELFPKLKHLQFWGLSGWEEWRGWSGLGLGNDDDDCCYTKIMPSLVSLSIHWCNALKAPLPAFLQKTPLKNLTINECRYL